MTTPRPPAVRLMQNLGLQPDPWQVEVLETPHKRLLLNCCRQAGKSTVVAVLALSEAVFVPFTKVLLLSRSHRQSMELFRIVTDYYARLDSPLRRRQSAQELSLDNHSRIICLPCKEETVRGYSDIGLLIIDEAARVPDDLYRSVRPMLATSDGRLICLSTPYGKRGFFHDCWSKGADDWLRIEIPADKVPRITPAFLSQERRSLGDSWYRQEYCCSFESLEGLVYPDFARCVVAYSPLSPVLRGEGPGVRGETVSDPNPQSALDSRAQAPPGHALPARLCLAPQLPTHCRLVGGLDFGFRNPFAAVWGILDEGDILWLIGEHYAREKPLSYHAQFLPRKAHWYADPAGANEISELRCANFTVSRGNNDRRLGIAAVRARLENGTLRVLEGRCPNLLAEAGLYRYGSPSETGSSETPIDDHNHALAALRYLIATLDARRMARKPKSGSDADAQSPLSPVLRGEGPGVRGQPVSDTNPAPSRKCNAPDFHDDSHWTRIY